MKWTKKLEDYGKVEEEIRVVAESKRRGKATIFDGTNQEASI
jgi:hypothetical protein